MNAAGRCAAPALSTTVEAIRQQGWDGLMTMQNAVTGTIRCVGAVRAMTAPAARILSGNAAPVLLAAYPDNATAARLEAGNAPGAKERNLTKMADSKRNLSAHSAKSALRACGTDR